MRKAMGGVNAHSLRGALGARGIKSKNQENIKRSSKKASIVSTETHTATKKVCSAPSNLSIFSTTFVK